MSFNCCEFFKFSLYVPGTALSTETITDVRQACIVTSGSLPLAWRRSMSKHVLAKKSEVNETHTFAFREFPEWEGDPF